MSGITIPRVLVAVRVGGAVRVGSGKLPNWIHIHARFICLLLWLRWSGLSLSAWQSHRRFISVSVGVGEERDSEAQPTGEDKIINQGFQCPIGKKEELFNPGLEKRSCNIIPLGRSTYQSARLVEQ